MTAKTIGQPATKDLVVLVADQQMEFTFRGLMTRCRSLACRDIEFDVFVHPAKDPGCCLRAQDFLRPFSKQYSYALVMHDREGCGRERLPREQLEADLESRLAATGWQDRAAVVVIDPELEAWAWSDSPEVPSVLGWTGREPSLTDWLREKGYCELGNTELNRGKPKDPKIAFDEALRISGKRRSAAIFRQLAERVGINRCIDPAFLKLKGALQAWFS